MARSRVRAAARKARDQSAQTIGSGVYSIAVDLNRAGGKLPLPVFVFAPLVYICEMVAAVLCEREGWTDQQRAEDVARYLMAGLQEFTVELFERFDAEHFEAWIAAANAAPSG